MITIEDQIANLSAQGFTPYQISTRLSISEYSVHKVLNTDNFQKIKAKVKNPEIKLAPRPIQVRKCRTEKEYCADFLEEKYRKSTEIIPLSVVYKQYEFYCLNRCTPVREPINIRQVMLLMQRNGYDLFKKNSEYYVNCEKTALSIEELYNTETHSRRRDV